MVFDPGELFAAVKAWGSTHASERHVQARLVVVGGHEARQFELRLPAVIGRSRSSDITLGNPLISRHHCEVYEVGGRLMLRDLDSLNGTFVGDTRLTGDPIVVEPGGRFSVGPVTLQADYEADLPEVESDEWESGATIDSPLDVVGDSKPASSSSSKRFLGGRNQPPHD